MGIKFSNNASANIIRAITSTATSVSVTAGKGDLFPSLTEGDYFYATLAGNNGLEIVKVTNRINDTMTIVRAQDNTTALSFDTGDLFELRIVAADFNDTFSEVNDKLEASIEETTSIVNSALSYKAPILHASSSTEYGAGSSEQYGHLKSHDSPDYAKTADTGHAFSPAGAAVMQEAIEEQIVNLAESQSVKDAEQDARIDKCVLKVNEQEPDANGNVNIGGLPLGTVFPYTGKDVPAGTLRADGATYTSMQTSFPAFYNWVVNSGLTVTLESYALVNGSCGYYGLDESTGTVRMPTLAAGVFGADAASKYGMAVEAGLPDSTGAFSMRRNGASRQYSSLSSWTGMVSVDEKGADNSYSTSFSLTSFDTADNIDRVYLKLSDGNPIYGKSDTVIPDHVKYPWVIVVYSAAVLPSVAEAGQFVELLDGKANNTDVLRLDGSLPMTGTLKFKYTDFVNGTLPSANLYKSVHFTDKNGTVISRILSFINTDGSAGISIGTNNYKGDGGLKAIGIIADANGAFRFTAGGKNIVAEDALVQQSNKGYIRLTNGLLLHWGYVTSTSQTVTINFSPAFSSANSYVVVPQATVAGSDYNWNPNVVRNSASKATFNSMIAKASGCFYIAIGY